MSTFSASVRVDDGMLHTSRPLTAPDAVSDMIDRITYDMVQRAAEGDVVAVEMVVETSGESETPIGDSVPSTSSQPLAEPGPPPDVDDAALAPEAAQA